ncbi:hypothetical protein Tco_0771013 [Tanacetum coccineum]|uniref:Uncharacterized protein n=1 Tax=Tanacetum coccineum TaxID=301880 RepID=A0ABQ4ZHD0_9ASTR
MKDNHQLQHDDLPIWLALKIKFEGLTVSNTPWRSFSIHLRDQDDPHDNAHPERENNAKRQKTSEHGIYVMGESSSGQANENESGPSTSELVEEMSETIDEAKQCKVESKKEFLSLPFPQKPIPVIQSCQRDPKALAQSLVNPDLLYLKKGNLRLEKFMLSLHKFPVVIFLMITEIIVRRANGSTMSITKPDYKNLNKNDIEDMYLLCVNGKVEDYVETGLMWSLSVFIRSTVICERVHDFQLGVQSYQQKVNLTAPTITFHGIKKYKMFSIGSKLVYGIIYKNNKKEKKVMRHQETHKFRDATLKRVLEGLKSYNNDVKHGYVTPILSKEDVKYLRLFEEEIEERLRYRDQIRR